MSYKGNVPRLHLQLLSSDKSKGEIESAGWNSRRVKTDEGRRGIEIKVMITEALSCWMWDSVVGQSFAGLLSGKRFMLSVVY